MKGVCAGFAFDLNARRAKGTINLNRFHHAGGALRQGRRGKIQGYHNLNGKWANAPDSDIRTQTAQH